MVQRPDGGCVFYAAAAANVTFIHALKKGRAVGNQAWTRRELNEDKDFQYKELISKLCRNPQLQDGLS